MKRPAEDAPEGAGRCGAGPPRPPEQAAEAAGNPFAGVSLFSQAAACSPFTAAAGGATSNGFAPAAAASSGFAPAAAASASGPDNPFMGLSLFSSPAGGGGLFTSAASTLQQGAGENPAGNFCSSQGSAGADSPKESQGAGAASAAREDAPASQQDTDGAEADTGDADSSAAELGKPTGEEDEEVIFHAECKLWKLVRQSLHPPTSSGAPANAAGSSEGGSGDAGSGADSSGNGADAADSSQAPAAEDKGWRWQERGCGIVHINRHSKTGAGRLVMRMRGVLKLLLNTPVFPTTKYERVGQKSVRFVGVDAEEGAAAPADGRVSLCAYRLNLQSNDQQGKFLHVLRDTLGVAMPA